MSTELSQEARPASVSRWRRPSLVLALLAVAQFIDVLDVTIVNVALPRIQRDLHFSGNNLQWVVSIYVLFYGGFLLFGGRIADAWGRRRTFVTGLAVFGASSLLAGLAPNTVVLLALRATQGLGAALMAPAALSLLTVAFPAGRQRDIALGIWGGLAGLGGVFGVIIGGALVDHFSWPAIFFVNVPVIAVLVALSPVILSESRAPSVAGRLDVAGPVLATLGLFTLVFAVIRTDAVSWGSWSTLSALGGAFALLVAFVLVENRHAHPMLPLSMLRSRSMSLGIVMLGLNGSVILTAFFLNSTFLQMVWRTSALRAGVDFVPMGIGAIIGAVVSGHIVTRVGTRPVQLLGSLMTGLGLVFLTQVSVTGSYVATMLPGFLLFGLGITTLGVSTQLAAMARVTHDLAGVASGLVNAAYQVGGAIGLAVVTTITTAHVTHALAMGTSAPRALGSGYHLGVLVALGLAAANALMALATPNVRPTPQQVRGLV